jgi:hypothetical protein
MHRILMLLSVIAILVPGSVLADTESILKKVPEVEKVGSGRLSFLIWNVYDATLYAPQKKYEASKPFALRLSYLIDLKGSDIAKRSVEEMRKQGFDNEAQLNKWQKAMEEIFPDIKSGNTITGIRNENGYAFFYLDNVFIGSINEEAFTNQFFAIWLDQKTSEPALRKKLLGIK